MLLQDLLNSVQISPIAIDVLPFIFTFSFILTVQGQPFSTLSPFLTKFTTASLFLILSSPGFYFLFPCSICFFGLPFFTWNSSIIETKETHCYLCFYKACIMNQEETKYQRLTETDMTIGIQNVKKI